MLPPTLDVRERLIYNGEAKALAQGKNAQERDGCLTYTDGLNSKYYTCSEHQGFLELFKTAPGYDVVASSVVNGSRWSGKAISMDTCSPKQRISELLPR